MNDKPLLSVISQGCAANFGDGEKIARIFSREYEVVFGNTEKTPDAFVLNVCTVKGNAGAIKLLRQALETAPDAKIYITGCTPKDFREEALKISRNITFTNLKELGSPDSSQVLRQSPQVGIVNIEEGCLDACAYCSTRLVKGRLNSFSAESIVSQVKRLVADGCREIQLTGQDCGCYGFDFDESISGPKNLAELVQKILAEVPGDYRMRLGMGNPRHMIRYKDQLLECFKDPRVYKFIHLPVQSGSDSILKAMNRKHSVQDFVDLAKEITAAYPRFTLSTDLIVGFPGETDQDFEDTLKVLKETRPTVCNITRFVSRPGTPASLMANAVPDAIKHQRSAQLAEAFQQIAQENNSLWIGDTETVTVEKSGYRKGTVIARDDAYRPVAIPGDYPAGARLTVRIINAEAFALIGEDLH
ncbi:MAG: MiaB/RimO family radical SAM methylthiotransferase [Fibrobacter sp.]|nr:MiaB/RimO family radical SAM methylthiotransferase [Fibrobacter sp.]